MPSSSNAAAAVSPPTPRPLPAPGAPKVIVLAGPTAVGKTAVSLEIAAALAARGQAAAGSFEDGLGAVEIINADSVQVYKGLDVGSDKLPPSQRRGIPHHLMDVLDPATDDWSAGAFHAAATAAIRDVAARGRTPLVVGGTGLYLRWLVQGKPSTPVRGSGGGGGAGSRAAAAAATAAAKAKVDAAVAAAEAAAGRRLDRDERWAAAVSTVADAGDPDAAARLAGATNNEFRLLRALTILAENGGVPLANHLDGGGRGGGGGGRGTAPSGRPPPPLAFDFRCVFLHAPRPRLYRAVDARAEAMVAGGLMREAAALAAAGLGPADTCATRAIGYRQALELLDAACAAGGGGGGVDPDAVTAMVHRIQAASRRLAHSQFHWFRGDALHEWVAGPDPPDPAEGGPDGGGGARAGPARSPAHVAADVLAIAARADPVPGAAAAAASAAAQELSPAEAAALRRYIPRLGLLNTPEGMAAAVAAVEEAVASLPPAAVAAARQREAARRAGRDARAGGGEEEA